MKDQLSSVDEWKLSFRPQSVQMPFIFIGCLHLFTNRPGISDSLVLLPRWRVFGKCCFRTSLILSYHTNIDSNILIIHTLIQTFLLLLFYACECLLARIPVYYTHVWSPQKPERAIRCGITGGYKLPCGGQEPNKNTSQEQ